MNFSFPYKRFLILSLIGGLVTGPLLTSCGGSGDGPTAGIGGTGITQGEITAFGSIFVNGVEFDTDNSQFEVDGDTTLGQESLSTGMIVTIKGEVNDDGVTGTADSVDYDDQIQGPVSTITPAIDGSRTLTIFDKSVLINETSTTYQGTSFADIAVDDIVEISGFNTSATAITATFIRKTNDNVIELKGTVTDFITGSSFFKLAGITINFDNSTVFDLAGGSLTDGLFVEVKGDLQSSPTSIMAREVELEEDAFEDGSEVSLQGVVSQVNSPTSFLLGSQLVDASNVSILPASGINVGINIEVEGEIINGILVASEIELRDGSVEIKAPVVDVDTVSNQIEFQLPLGGGSVFVSINNRTQFEDEFLSIPAFSIADIDQGNFVKIKGFENDGEIIASRVKRLNPIDEDTEIQGRVSAFTEDPSIPRITSITILGLTFTINNTVTYDPLTLPSTIEIGNIIELVDKNPADGIIDEVESD